MSGPAPTSSRAVLIRATCWKSSGDWYDQGPCCRRFPRCPGTVDAHPECRSRHRGHRLGRQRRGGGGVRGPRQAGSHHHGYPYAGDGWVRGVADHHGNPTRSHRHRHRQLRYAGVGNLVPGNRDRGPHRSAEAAGHRPPRPRAECQKSDRDRQTDVGDQGGPALGPNRRTAGGHSRRPRWTPSAALSR